MYVEADTLIPCGEALARACLLGQEVFLRETGEICTTLWLPDVFGYSQSIPQIASAAGITSFYTTKLLWSSIHHFPFSSFVWEGLDGSELLSHISQVGYESRADVSDVMRCSNTNKQAALFDDAILAAGFGDGGGGLNDEEGARAERLKGFYDLPSVSWQRADEFFSRLSEVKEQLPRYRGELYLEYHRGTYTTNHKMKQAYRIAEKALQTVEAAAVCTGRKIQIKHLWKRLVFTQFHDALPGSSIAEVYEEIIPQLNGIVQNAETSAENLLSSDGQQPVLFNPNGIDWDWLVYFDSSDIDSLSEAGKITAQGSAAAAPVQKLSSGQFAARVPLKGLSAAPISLSRPVDTGETAEGIRVISGDRAEAHFSETGFLDRLIIDGTELEIAAPAMLMLYPDYPANFDAWDIDRSAANLGYAPCSSMNLKCIDSGPIITRIQAESDFGMRSHVKITYSIARHLPYLLISVTADWQEEHSLLTYQIPTGYAGIYSRFGAPFGSIDRLTSSGSYTKEAMWEMPASRWMAVTDGDSEGLAFMTQDTYGFSVTDGTVDLSLLRSPCSSDEMGIRKETIFADKGVHTFSFALGTYCRRTEKSQLSTAQAADALFNPPVYMHGAPKQPLFTILQQGSLTVSWIKPAENQEGWIIRMHEAAGSRGEAVIALSAVPTGEIYCTDLLEQPKYPVSVSGKKLFLQYEPYELLSICIPTA